MKKIESSEIQGIELDILVKLLDFFKENNIDYFTSGGTTLGSIRHKGFIPWDDDIDLFIKRPDYDRLLKLSDGKLIDGYISLKKPGDKNYVYPFIKACNEKTIIYEKNLSDNKYAIGIFVDIFPLDKHYDNKILNTFLVLKTKWFSYLLKTASNQTNLSKTHSVKWLIKECARTFQKPFAKKWTVEKTAMHIDNIGRKMENKQTHYLGNLVMRIGFKDYYNSEYFASKVNGKFEGLNVNNPVGYHQYLSEMYGDYMTPPPKEKQIMHGFDAYYKD